MIAMSRVPKNSSKNGVVVSSIIISEECAVLDLNGVVPGNLHLTRTQIRPTIGSSMCCVNMGRYFQLKTSLIINKNLSIMTVCAAQFGNANWESDFNPVPDCTALRGKSLKEQQRKFVLVMNVVKMRSSRSLPCLEKARKDYESCVVF